MTIEEIWENITNNLKNTISQETYDLWIKPIKPIGCEEDKFTLQVPNKFFADWVRTNQEETIIKLIKEITDRDIALEYTFLHKMDTIFNDTPGEAETSSIEKVEANFDSNFNPKYTFESFIEGASNRFAKAACVAAANNPGKEYNPIFIYGGVGLGKTHLLHAIGNKILERDPKQKMLYITSEKFITEFIDSIRYGTPALFRNKFRTLDSLLIDDIQFLTDRERSQEEFFYTFNTLYDSRKQIVITSDRTPKELANIEERLISRFEWGIIADIKPPDLETRIAILRKKSESEKVFVPDDVILFLATQIKSNIRELEGSLIRIVAFSSLTGTPLTVDVAKEILEDVIRRQESTKPITIEIIQDIVTKHYHLEHKDLRSKKRTDAIALPRQIAMYLARNLTEMSTIEIGESFGGKDHTTVIHACNKIKNKMNSDPFFVAEINKIIQKIKQQE